MLREIDKKAEKVTKRWCVNLGKSRVILGLNNVGTLFGLLLEVVVQVVITG